MENLVSLICDTSTSFTPDVLVRLILTVMVIDCIASIADSLLNGWK